MHCVLSPWVMGSNKDTLVEYRFDIMILNLQFKVDVNHSMTAKANINHLYFGKIMQISRYS